MASVMTEARRHDHGVVSHRVNAIAGAEHERRHPAR
jgi:hypothetical protein